MNGKQYNEVIDWTLKHDKFAQTGDSLAAARAIFKNMGVALPNGTLKEVCDTVKRGNYMGWRACGVKEAQQAADNGTAAMGISENRIVVLTAADEEDTVDETAAVMTLSETTSAYAVADLQFYSYGSGKSTESTIPTCSKNYCGGSNYRDVTQHSLVLQTDGTYVCSTCGYTIKSPVLQDKDILSEEDYYKVLSCYLAIPYYAVLEKNGDAIYIPPELLFAQIDEIRSKSEYASRYDYVDGTGMYKKDHVLDVPIGSNFKVSCHEITNWNLSFHNGLAEGVLSFVVGLAIPTPYNAIFSTYTNDTPIDDVATFLSLLAEKAGGQALGIIIDLIALGTIGDETIDIGDKVVYITLTSTIVKIESKLVFSSHGLYKAQYHSYSL